MNNYVEISETRSMMMKTIHKYYVVRTVEPFVSNAALNDLRAALDVPDWRKVGHETWSASTSARTVRLTQRADNTLKFDLEIE